MARPMPENIAAIQGAAIIVLLALIGVYDVWIGNVYSWRATVSWQIQEWASTWPILTLAVGIVLGHVFWPTQPHNVAK